MNKRTALPQDIDQFFAGKSIFFGEHSPTAPAEAAAPAATTPPSTAPATSQEPPIERRVEPSALPFPQPHTTTSEPASLPLPMQPAPLSSPTNDAPLPRTNGRTNARTKVRHTFDIYQDQLASLRKIQLKRDEMVGKRCLLGDLVQEALDQFITQEQPKA